MTTLVPPAARWQALVEDIWALASGGIGGKVISSKVTRRAMEVSALVRQG